MKIYFNIIFILPLVLFEIMALKTNATEVNEFHSKSGKTTVKVLSRRKRFLIFPDGSSFQIVFCTQNHGYLQIGNIVWFGSTAAMAWELPTDPGAFDMFRDRYKVFEGQRRSDILYYVDEDGKVVDKIEYRRKILINPALAKRSVDAVDDHSETITKVKKKGMHDSQKNKTVFKDLDETSLQLHRNERQKLYVKLEKFLQTLGWNGNECILKMLCVTNMAETKQKSFVGEILKALFSLPDVPGTVSKLHKQYNDARGANGNCSELYPNCGDISML